MNESQSTNKEADVPQHQENSKNLKRVIRVSPWKNKEEFEMVYKWLFAEDANNETKQEACRRMRIWKMRRSNLTPAAILSTLVMTEIQLKDDLQEVNHLTTEDLTIIYSSAVTRFLNFMSSILQTKNLKTMYETAKELGLPSFIVDLRHMCAHGQTMPHIDLFRRATTFCIKWLKENYWDHEIHYMRNVSFSKDSRDRIVRNKSHDEIEKFFNIYDVISEAMIRNCFQVQQAKKRLSPTNYITLRRFSNVLKNRDLRELLRICVKKLSSLVKQKEVLRGGSQIYLEALMNMNFFFESAAFRTKTHEEIALMINVHQPLFQTMAIKGFIEELFHSLIATAEDEYETTVKRKGSSFWAYQIVKGFIAFKAFKFKYTKLMAKFPKKKIHISTINKLKISNKILKIYKHLKIDIETTLIFGDSVRNPWSLYFKRDYIEKRMIKVNVFTLDVIKECLQLVIPTLKSNEKDILENLMESYVAKNLLNDDDDEDSSDSDDDDDVDNDNGEKKSPIEKQIKEKNLKWNDMDDDTEIFTLSKHILGNNTTEKDIIEEQDGEEKIGIWTRVPDNQDWSRCPLGRLPWE